MENTATINDIVDVLKILSDKTRLKILLLIDKEEACVCDIVNALGMSQPAISQQLRKMKSSGLIKENERGKWNYYHVNQKSSMYFLVKEVLSKVSFSEHPRISANRKPF